MCEKRSEVPVCLRIKWTNWNKMGSRCLPTFWTTLIQLSTLPVHHWYMNSALFSQRNPLIFIFCTNVPSIPGLIFLSFVRKQHLLYDFVPGGCRGTWELWAEAGVSTVWCCWVVELKFSCRRLSGGGVSPSARLSPVLMADCFFSSFCGVLFWARCSF